MELNKEWFEMTAIRRRLLANAVWIPLRQVETVTEGGEKYTPGRYEEKALAGAIAFPQHHRELAERLGWHELGLPRTAIHAFEDGRYKPAEIYQYDEGEDAGLHLVLAHNDIADLPTQWLVNQDLILALGLIQEGKSWVRPSEGYVEVIRQRDNPDGSLAAIEIKAEFLRDYLAARGMALRVAVYRQRMAILKDAAGLPDWRTDPIRDSKDHERFETRQFDVAADGGLLGSVAVFHAWRTDVDPEDDVPVMGPETSENTKSTHRHYERQGPTLLRVEGEYWREEWIEPADRSERVRGDDPIDQILYIVDAAGNRKPGPELDDEDIGRWLWFTPGVITSLLRVRGAKLDWYTHDTGSVHASYGYSVHFGVNEIGLVNVYAYDIARLPMWQQRIWASNNVTPNGALSKELHASQALADPADTVAPEEAFRGLWLDADALTMRWIGAPLFQKHDSSEAIIASIHRFRALDEPGLLSLAKDIARVTADMIDLAPLRSVAPPPAGQKFGSLKQLEKALATITEPERARDALTPLVGIYELRLGDAHLPSSKIQEAFSLAGVDRTVHSLEQGTQLIEAAVRGMEAVSEILHRRLK